MSSAAEMPAGGYTYVPGVFQYSGGVGAMPGYAIERVRFDKVMPLDAGFMRISEILHARGRPLTAFCSCELRSPGQFSEEGFRAFNELYVATLESWGIYKDGVNPVARSNVCPEIDGPEAPGFHAFCFTVPTDTPHKTFAIAGSGEAPEGKATYRDHVVRRGDTSPEGLLEKCRFVLDEMERRMDFFGAGWSDVTATQVYSVFDIHPLMAAELVRRGAGAHGIDWHYCRPPIVELDYEMDCRRVLAEHVEPV